MTTEQQLITTFYSKFQQRDWKGMLECYNEEVFFYDPVFESLEGRKVRAMWEMLLSVPGDLQLTFGQVEGAEGYGSCEWTATYTFTPTGRKVINKVKAYFFIADGKIAEHHDDFSLWRWCAQALGIRGMVLGWTSKVQQLVKWKARTNLEKFMQAKKS
jgi:hypothetical protein